MLAGSAVAVGVWMLLQLFGSGIALAMMKTSDWNRIHAIGIGSSAWSVIAVVGALFLGGMLAGKLSVLTGQTVTDPAELAAQLGRAASVGYALEDGEAAIGDAGIAAPVQDRDGVVGAIGLVGPVERLLGEARRDEYAVAVRETARLLSRDMGGGGRSALRRA